MKRRLYFLISIAVLLGLCFAGCAAAEARVTAAPDPEYPGTPHAVTGYIVIRGFEWGPGVNKVILELDTEVDRLLLDESTAVTTSHYERTVTAAYLSDSMGYETKENSRYVTFELETSFDCTGSPFEVDMETELNVWADEYVVAASTVVVKDDTHFVVSLNADCIENRICPELSRFTEPATFTGEYENPLTHQMDTLTLSYAAYEPDNLESWEQNPLIIWLHGLGEGGTDIEKTILGNEASALTESVIQSYFQSGEQIGAYVLIVQTPTYWLDAGDNTYHRGDLPSRYTEILMDTIEAYIESNPDVDPDRIYIGGASNGGFMTLEMLINYPDYFAAAFPCCPAYSYNVYAKDFRGSYRTVFINQYIKTNMVYLTEDKIEALLETPIWFLQAMTDTIVPAYDYTLPVYRALVQAGASDAWCSLYFNSVGTESADTLYLGHWVWIYLLNDQVSDVQDTEAIRESTDRTFMWGYRPESTGGSVQVTDEEGNAYESIFAWMNDQERD